MESAMTSISYFRENSGGSRKAGDEILMDYRQRRAHEEYERAERKRLELADQRSEFNGPGARIRAWEKAHGLRLPTSPNHPVVSVVAAATNLTLADVQAEQGLRLAQTTPAAV